MAIFGPIFKIFGSNPHNLSMGNPLMPKLGQNDKKFHHVLEKNYSNTGFLIR